MLPCWVQYCSILLPSNIVWHMAMSSLVITTSKLFADIAMRRVSVSASGRRGQYFLTLFFSYFFLVSPLSSTFLIEVVLKSKKSYLVKMDSNTQKPWGRPLILDTVGNFGATWGPFRFCWQCRVAGSEIMPLALLGWHFKSL